MLAEVFAENPNPSGLNLSCGKVFVIVLLMYTDLPVPVCMMVAWLKWPYVCIDIMNVYITSGAAHEYMLSLRNEQLYHICELSRVVVRHHYVAIRSILFITYIHSIMQFSFANNFRELRWMHTLLPQDNTMRVRLPEEWWTVATCQPTFSTYYLLPHTHSHSSRTSSA